MVICFMFSSGAGFEPAAATRVFTYTWREAAGPRMIWIREGSRVWRNQSSCRVSRRQHNERVETQRPRQVSTLIIEKMPGTVYAPDPDPRFERARLGRRQQRLPRHRTLPAMDEKALSVAVPVAQFELTWLGRPQAAPVGNGEIALSRVDSIPLRKRLSYSSVRYLRCFSCVNSVSQFAGFDQPTPQNSA
jgi:hypothetical protein